VAHGRKTRRKGRKLPSSEPAARLGAHWRADGAPKTAYRSQGEALSVADERRQDSGIELNVYVCDYCSAWHLGNAEGRRRS
jgi:hypothetical protein